MVRRQAQAVNKAYPQCLFNSEGVKMDPYRTILEMSEMSMFAWNAGAADA